MFSSDGRDADIQAVKYVSHLPITFLNIGSYLWVSDLNFDPWFNIESREARMNVGLKLAFTWKAKQIPGMCHTT